MLAVPAEHENFVEPPPNELAAHVLTSWVPAPKYVLSETVVMTVPVHVAEA
jgi:hypothetical protein